MIKNLEKFGKIEQCEVINDKFHCKITEGFKNEALNISKCYGTILALAGEKYQWVEQYDIEENMFHLILNSKSNGE